MTQAEQNETKRAWLSMPSAAHDGWWHVTNGTYCFSTPKEHEADWLCAFLNEHEEGEA